MVIDALERYSSALAALGSQAPARLLPADRSELIRATLREHGIQPRDDLVDFFAWSGGTGPDGPPFFLDVRIVSISAALEIRRELLAIAREAALDDEEASSDDFFDSAWVPLGPSDPQLVVDTGPGPTSGNVLAVWWDQPPVTEADSIEAFVERRRAQLVDGEVRLAGDSLVRHPLRLAVRPVTVIRIGVGREDLIPSALERIDKAAAAAEADPDAEVAIVHNALGDIPGNDRLELHQRDLVVEALVAAGVDRNRLTAQTTELADHQQTTHHLLGIFVR
ncbi:MAG: hypothetical protein HKN44_10745 [Ilumatobacter sp.]|nr:hypothetical protein [Ilumatobacter sp.]